jgi:uncharacterized protein involved in exopolysaccharide biosynthesis
LRDDIVIEHPAVGRVMKAPRTLFGRVLGLSWLADPLRRRLTFVALAVVFAVLTFFPRYYHASVQIIEPTPNAAGLSAVLGQLGGNYAALLSTGQSYEVNLSVGRTYLVERDVVTRMNLVGTPRFGSLDHAVRKLRRLLTVRSMRGGIIGLEAEDRNPDFALQLVTVYAQVYSERLAQLARQQTAYKRAVLNDRMGEAAQRLARAQGALDRFRAQNRLPAPDAQLGASVGQLSGLQASLQAKRVELQSALKFATPDNMQVRAIQAEIVSIQTQIAQEQSRRGQTATALAGLSNQHDNLIRDVSFAQSLYQAYSRYLEGSAIEELSAAWNIQQIEPPHIHVGHQINKLPAAILLLILLAAIASEIYLLFPPVGTRVELAARMAK